MQQERLASAAGIAACLAVVGAVVAPYFVAPFTSVSAYYDSAVGPPIVGIFAIVALLAFAAGRNGRTDPATAAGAALGIGVIVTMLAVVWAVSVPQHVVLQLSRAAALESHRWVLVVVSLAVPVTAAWYAKAVL